MFTMRSFQFKINRYWLAAPDSIGQRANTIVGWGAFTRLPWQTDRDWRAQKKLLQGGPCHPV